VFHGLWQLGIAQAVSNLGYASAAWFDLPREAIYAASVLESFCSGLGTAAFLSFLMNLCDKEYAAVEYAMLSAIFGFSRSISGAVSGWATEQMGYGAYFAFTFLLAFPAYALLPVVRRWVRTTEPAHPSP
ncbi:MAG: MFS transporter, partial [Candidatus Eisenbacteria bacterium]|nr:MFS transporter [Candidatus Eisenbacteria bacterium]